MRINQRKYYGWGVLLPAAILLLIQLGVYIVRASYPTAGHSTE